MPKAHPTAGYRLWAGALEAAEQIVALAILKSGTYVSWARCSHRAVDPLELRILFSPTSQDGRLVSVAFGIGDAHTYGVAEVESSMTHPAPEIADHVTGELVDIGVVHGVPEIEMKAIFMARSDVKSVRNGVWHARVAHLESLEDPWRTMLTYGRAGEFDLS